MIGNVSDLLILERWSVILCQGEARSAHGLLQRRRQDGGGKGAVSSLPEWSSSEIRDRSEWQGPVSLSKWRSLWTNIHPCVYLPGARTAGEAPHCRDDPQWQG